MTTFIEKYQTIIIRIFVGLGILLALFLLVVTLFKVKEYRFIGSGMNPTNTITVQGSGKIDRAPDTAKISFTVQDEQKQIKIAQDTVSKKVDAITKALITLGVEQKYIKTESYNSYPQYDYPNNNCVGISCAKPNTPILRGYQVSHNIIIRVKNIDAVQAVIGILGDNAVTNISGPNFGFDDDKAVLREARDLAISDAKIEAEKLAKSLGVRLLRIVSFSESNAGYPQPMYAVRDSVNTQEKIVSTPALPVGEQKIQSNVTMVYEIQ